jgi:hypothetical protein
MTQKYVVREHGGACSRRTRLGLAADSADLMRMMMAELAEVISADSILVKAHLNPGE